MKPISENEAAALLQRWRMNANSIQIGFDASASFIEGGMINELETSPGQIVISIWLLKSGIAKRLVLRDCEFSADAGTLLVSFSDGRVLRLDMVPLD